MVFTLIARVAKALDKAAISYMLIGGQAVGQLGEPRFTKDIDFTLGVAPDHFADVMAVVRRLGLVPIEGPVPAERFAQECLLLLCTDKRTHMRVDFIFSIMEYERQAIRRARKMVLGGYRVTVATAEDLIILKMIAGRPRDIEDVQGLVLKNPKLNVAYVRRWLGAYSSDLAQPLLAQFDRLRADLRRRLRGR